MEDLAVSLVCDELSDVDLHSIAKTAVGDRQDLGLQSGRLFKEIGGSDQTSPTQTKSFTSFLRRLIRSSMNILKDAQSVVTREDRTAEHGMLPCSTHYLYHEGYHGICEPTLRRSDQLGRSRESARSVGQNQAQRKPGQR